MKPIAALVLAFGASATLGVAAAKAAPWQAPAQARVPALLVVVFAVSPYLPLAAATVIARSRTASAIALAGTVLTSLFGLGVYYDAFVRKDNVLHALLFLAVPVVQWGIALVTLVLGILARLRAGPG